MGYRLMVMDLVHIPRHRAHPSRLEVINLYHRNTIRVSSEVPEIHRHQQGQALVPLQMLSSVQALETLHMYHLLVQWRTCQATWHRLVTARSHPSLPAYQQPTRISQMESGHQKDKTRRGSTYPTNVKGSWKSCQAFMKFRPIVGKNCSCKK